MEFKDAGLQLRLMICILRKIYSVHSEFNPQSMKTEARKHQQENVAASRHVPWLYNSIYQPNPQFSAFPRQECCCKMIRARTLRDREMIGMLTSCVTPRLHYSIRLSEKFKLTELESYWKQSAFGYLMRHV